MAFNRRRRFRRKPGRTFRRRKFSRMRTMRRMIPRAEVKAFRTDFGPDLVSTTPTITYSLTTGITRGTGLEDRIGSDIKPFMITIRMHYVSDVAATVVWYLVRWKQDQQANPLDVSDILGSPGVVTSFRQYPGRKQYKILKRGKFEMAPLVAGVPRKKLLLVKKRVSQKIYYQIASPDVNHLFFLTYSDVAAGATPPTVEGESKLFYTDS